jgi:hypothetical protein
MGVAPGICRSLRGHILKEREREPMPAIGAYAADSGVGSGVEVVSVVPRGRAVMVVEMVVMVVVVVVALPALVGGGYVFG